MNYTVIMKLSSFIPTHESYILPLSILEHGIYRVVVTQQNGRDKGFSAWSLCGLHTYLTQHHQMRHKSHTKVLCKWQIKEE